MAGEDTFVSGLAGRYALALFDLADQGNRHDVVAENLKSLRALIDDSEDLQRLLRSPLFSRDQQTKAMQQVVEKGDLDDLVRRFVMIVAANRRLFALPQMIDAYLAELARRRGEVTAEVTAARELSDAQHTALVEALNRTAGGKVKIDLKIDPSLLGGLVVKVGSRMVDSSIKSKLQRLQFAMKGVG